MATKASPPLNVLYPKSFLEHNDPEKINEGPISHVKDFNSWLEEVDSNLEFYYGQFITRLLIDMSTILIPYFSFAKNKSYMRLFFRELNKEQSVTLKKSLYNIKEEKIDATIQYIENNRVEDKKWIRIEPNYDPKDCNPLEFINGDVLQNSYFSLLWSLAALNDERNLKGGDFPDLIHKEGNYKKFAELFLSQISPNANIEDFFTTIELIFYYLSDEHSFRSCNLYSSELSELSKLPWMELLPQFCDLFLFYQVVEFLVRQLAIPYHVNLIYTKRWSYVAKETRMFTDLLVLDECRYLYDWMSGIGNIRVNLIGDLERQLILRFVLDGISRHSRWFVEELFYGSAIIDKFRYKEFEFKKLSLRKYIN